MSDSTNRGLSTLLNEGPSLVSETGREEIADADKVLPCPSSTDGWCFVVRFSDSLALGVGHITASLRDVGPKRVLEILFVEGVGQFLANVSSEGVPAEVRAFGPCRWDPFCELPYATAFGVGNIRISSRSPG